MRRLITTTAIFFGVVGLVYGQSMMRRATMTGSRGDRGKCTIEVEIDQVAEVEIIGDRATLRTISGSPANWRRFECSDVLPANPEDFRFRGIDGRGRQTLIRDPRGNRGMAVIRLEDSKSGREGYTFDIEWRGFGGPQQGGGYGRPGYNQAPPPPPPPAFGTDRAIAICQDAVRARVADRYGFRNGRFLRTNIDDRPGRNDWVLGTFLGERGRDRDEFTFSCSVDFRSGRVRDVEVHRR